MYDEQVGPGCWRLRWWRPLVGNWLWLLSPGEGMKINSGSSCFHLPSFMLSVGFPLICWIYVLWRVALTESLLFFPLSFSFWASRSRALEAIIISRAAHTPDPFAPRRILRRRSRVPVIFYYVTCEIFFFFQGVWRCSTRFNNRNSLLFPYKIKSHQKEAFNPVTLRWLADLIFSGCELCGGDELPKGGGQEKRARLALSLQPLMKLS